MPLVGRCCPAKFPPRKAPIFARNQRCYELVLTFYNPDTGLFYVMALENCNVLLRKTEAVYSRRDFYGTGTKLPADEHSQKVLLALSLSDGKQVWRYAQAGHGDSWEEPRNDGRAGFFGDDAGTFEAVDAETGRPLWHFNTGSHFMLRR